MTPFGVRVSSSVRTQVVAVESGRVSVDAFDEWQAELRPEESRGEAAGEHRVEVQNRGNAVLTVAVALADQPAGIAVDGLPTSLTIEPGQRASAEFRPRAAEAPAPGSERRHPIEVMVESPAAEQRLRGTFVQVGPAPRLEWYAQLMPQVVRGEIGRESCRERV